MQPYEEESTHHYFLNPLSQFLLVSLSTSNLCFTTHCLLCISRNFLLFVKFLLSFQEKILFVFSLTMLLLKYHLLQFHESSCIIAQNFLWNFNFLVCLYLTSYSIHHCALGSHQFCFCYQICHHNFNLIETEDLKCFREINL